MLAAHDPSVSRWLNDAGRFQLLTAEQEISLGREIQAWLTATDPDRKTVRRGERARERMVACNLRLVANVERRTARGGEKLDRLQAGALGLIRAAEKFDPARGYRFSTYAFWWVKKSIARLAATEPASCGMRVPATWPIGDPRREEFDRSPVALNRAIRITAGGRATCWSDLVVGGRLDLDQLARAEELGHAVAALELAGGDDLALVELHAEGHGVEELGPLVDRKSAGKAIRKARARLAALPEVVAALAG